MTRSFRKKLGDWGTVLVGDPCAYCGERSEVVDHIDATALGGRDQWENATGACTRCNAGKHARSLLSFLGYRVSGIAERIAEAQAERTAWMRVGA